MLLNRKKIISWYKLTGFIAGCIILCGGSSLSQNKYQLLIDNFELIGNVNLIGGTHGCWRKDSSEKEEYSSAEYHHVLRNKKKTTVLHLKYKVTDGDYGGYFSKLNGIDIRQYTTLEFYVKGGKKFPRTFKIELNNHLGEVGYYYLHRIKNNWQKVSIPLDEFRGIENFSRMRKLVIVFEGGILGTSEGELYLDDIKFTTTSAKYKKWRAFIQKESRQKKKELKRISNLPKDELLDVISRKAFNYFWNESSSITGFIRDRNTPHAPSSIAATGFGLTAICIGVYRGWITHQEAYERVKKTLTAIRDKSEHHRGIFYHFIDMDTGERVWRSEVSPIDTALLWGGIITVREFFEEKDIKKLCDEIFRMVDWRWMMDPESKALYMGWNPETKFKDFILWDMFSEQMIMYILGLGAPRHRHALPEESWHSFRRPLKTYKDYTYIHNVGEPLFVYQYSHAFIDFRNIYDLYANYWENSIRATKASIAFCKEYKDDYLTYSKGFWGLSAGDGPDGYRAYGATVFTHDGTVIPYAIAASVPFVPEIAISTMRKLILEYGEKVWDDRYGFVSAFNLDRNWFSTEHIGIDLGITLLMIENHRSEFVWRYFMKNEYVQRGLKKAGFREGRRRLNVEKLKQLEQEKAPLLVRKEYIARWVESLDEIRKDDFEKIDITDSLEFGKIKGLSDLGIEFAFLWNEEHLYFVVDVKDDKVLASESKENLYKGDCVELYLNPVSDTLIWGDRKNFQIGFAPDSVEKKPVMYAFFQKIDPSDSITLTVDKKEDGYRMKISIDWDFLRFSPKSGSSLGMSFAVHDKDSEVDKKKINWEFKVTPSDIKIGNLILK